MRYITAESMKVSQEDKREGLTFSSRALIAKLNLVQMLVIS